MTIVLDSLETGNSLTKLNENFRRIEEYLNDDGVSRKETKPYEANIDMNSNRLLNLPAPASLHEPLRVIDGIEGIEVNVDPKWGNITGNLNEQTDVYTEIISKQPLLASTVNIKSINGQSLLGSGDLTVGGGGTSVSIPQYHVPHRSSVGLGAPDGSIKADTLPTPTTIAVRSVTGHIHTVSPIENDQAATKKYVDDKVAAGGGGSSGYVPPNIPPDTVLARGAVGWGAPDTYMTASDQAFGNALAKRNATGHLYGATPTLDAHLATKAYVDSLNAGGAKARIQASVFTGAPASANTNCPFDRSTDALNASLNTATGVITVQRTGWCTVTGVIVAITRRNNQPVLIPQNIESPDNSSVLHFDVFIGGRSIRIYHHYGQRINTPFSFQAPVLAGDTIRINTVSGLGGDWAGSQYVGTLAPHIEVAVL